jgi:hypothetical protein
MYSAGLEPAILAMEQLQTYTLVRTATGTGNVWQTTISFSIIARIYQYVISFKKNQSVQLYGAQVAVCSQIIQSTYKQCGQNVQLLNVKHDGASRDQ